MTKALLMALTAVFLVSCGGRKEDPYVPFVNPEGRTPEQGGTVTPTGDPAVTTGAAVDITSVGALLQDNTYANAPSKVVDRGIFYGTSAETLDMGMSLGNAAAKSGTFRVQLLGLASATTYYYKAYITVSGAQGNESIYGEVMNFTTLEGGSSGGGSTQGPVTGLQYLGCYEMPAIDLKNTEASNDSGRETWGGTSWFNYLTGNDNQMVVTHTYAYSGKQYRNWTALVDKDKKSPLWSAFVMHKGAYPDNNVGRVGSWTYGNPSKDNTDPGIPASWQKSVASSTYSRGHHVASDYRQATSDANWQTFYWTNQSLQLQNGFNSGVWSSLEQAVVSNAPTGRDTLYVVVGTLYENPNNYISTNQGTTELAPSHFYKCLMKCSFDDSGAMTAAKGCAYIFANESHGGSNYNDTKFRTTIDAIEQRAGFNFFANVPEALQNTAEAQTAALW